MGQNIAWGYGSWDAAVQGWFNEVTDFNFGVEEQDGEVGHYTQVGRGVCMCVCVCECV